MVTTPPTRALAPRSSLARLARCALLATAFWLTGPGALAQTDGGGSDAGAEAPAVEMDAGAAGAETPDAGEAPPDAGAASETTEAGGGTRLSELRSDAEAVPLYQRGLSLVGLATMVFLAWLLSAHRKRFPWKIVLWGVALQMLFGVFVLKTPVGLALFAFLNDAVGQLLAFTDDGSRFLFGDYLDNEFTVALNVLPTIIFFSSLMAVLYHLRIMQPLVRAVAWVMQRTLGTSGAETLSAAANIFVGQTEAPLVVRPFVDDMTRSELMAVMTGGFATVAGGVLAAYVGMLDETFPDIAGHLIAASVMSAPAALVVAKVIMPEVDTPKTAGSLDLTSTDGAEPKHTNVIDAAASGAADGLKLALNVAAMLLAFLALVAMVNYLVALPALLYNGAQWDGVLAELARAGADVPTGCEAPDGAAALQSCIDGATRSGLVSGDYGSWTPWSLQLVLGYLFWPLAFVMGVPIEDCGTVAALLGEKLILNEFVAYLHLGEQLQAGQLGERATVIATYALCGFANLGSIGIQIGGIGGIAPKRRGELAALGVRAMLGGTLAAFMTACVAGALV